MSKTKFTFEGREHLIPHRDSQRQRCYDAENAVDWGEDLVARMDLKECQRFADRVTSSVCWYKMRLRHGFGDPRARKITVEQKTHGNATAYPGMWLVRLPDCMMTKHVMLHELAHVACGPSIGHHWPFARAFADLVSRFMSVDLARALKSSYRKHKVRYSVPPPPLSEERKRALGEQGIRALGLRRKEERA